MTTRAVVVIAAYNEADSIPQLLRELEALASYDLELGVVVVDDGSTDATWDVLSSLAYDWLYASRLRRNHGKSVAQRVGLEAAVASGADAVVFMDADGEHPPHLVPRLAHRAHQTECITVGQRVAYVRSSVRLFLSGFVLTLARVLGVPHQHYDSEFLALPLHSAEAVLLASDLGAIPILQAVAQVAVGPDLERIAYRIEAPFVEGRSSRWTGSMLAQKAVELLLWDVFAVLRRIAILVSLLVVAVAGYAFRIGLDSASRRSGIGSVILVQGLIGFGAYMLLLLIAVLAGAILTTQRRLYRDSSPQVSTTLGRSNWWQRR